MSVQSSATLTPIFVVLVIVEYTDRNVSIVQRAIQVSLTLCVLGAMKNVPIALFGNSCSIEMKNEIINFQVVFR